MTNSRKEPVTILRKTQKATAILSLICSLLLFLDYLLPGNLALDTITKFDAFATGKRGGSLSYKLVCNNYSFPVSAEFTAGVNIGDSVSLELSPIFKIINAYRAASEKEYQTYYIRYLTGIIFPLLLLLFSLISLRFQNLGQQLNYMLLSLHCFTLFFTLMTLYTESQLFNTIKQ